MKETRVDATIDSIKEFTQSLLWKDIKRELAMWKKGFEQELLAIAGDAAENNPSTASVLLHIGDINGRVKAVDYLLAIPTVFIELKSMEAEDKKKTSKEEEGD